MVFSKKLPVVVAVLLVAALLTGCGTPATPETIEKVVTQVVPQTVVVAGTPEIVEVEVTAVPEAKGGELILSSTKAGSRLDPHLDVDWEVLYVLSPIYDTLVYEASDGTFVPGLAKEWTVSEDGLTYSFTLRDDVKFTDGTPFNAEAVKFNFGRIAEVAPKSEKAGSLMASVASVEATDEFTIAVKLSQPDGFFLWALSLPYLSMVSPTAAQQWGEEYHLHQVGTGPFMFSEYLPEDHYTLVPNPDYNWAPSIFSHQGPAYLSKITWRFLPEPATRAPALEAGDVDVAIDLLPTDANRIGNSPDLSLVINLLTGQPQMWFLNTKLAPTDDILVRQAILYGIDIQAGVNAVMRGLNPVAHGPLSAVTAEYAKELDAMYPYDQEKAKALLDQAGWVDSDGDGIRDKGGVPLTILMSVQGWGQSQPFSELAQGQLKAIGIDLQLEMMSFPTQMQAGADGIKNMLIMGGSGYSAVDSLSGYFHSKNAETGFAWSKYADPNLDALLDQGAAALDPAERLELYRQAQVLIMDQALIRPIYDYALLVGVNNKVKGLTWRSVGLVPTLYDTYIEP